MRRGTSLGLRAFLNVLVMLVAFVLLGLGYLQVQALAIGIEQMGASEGTGMPGVEGGLGEEVTSWLVQYDFQSPPHRLKHWMKKIGTTAYNLRLAKFLVRQFAFIGIALLVTVFLLILTSAFALLLDWVENGWGKWQLSSLIRRVLDTIPYTVWLLFILGLQASFVGWIENRTFGEEPFLANLAGQSVIYAGTYFLLLPLFLSRFTSVVQRAREDQLFDALAMDGLSTWRIYQKVFRYRLADVAVKAGLFAFAFILLFETSFIVLNKGRTPSGTVVGAGFIPQQAEVSPFAQWATIVAQKPLADVKIAEQDLVALSQSACGALKVKTVMQNCSGLVIGAAILTGWAKASDFSSQQLILAMQGYPGLRLVGSWWKIITNDHENADWRKANALADQIAAHDGKIPIELIETAFWSGYAAVYYYICMALITLLVGLFAVSELMRFSELSNV